MAETELISKTGLTAVGEAMEAIKAGKNVILPSDVIPLAKEIELKRTAAERGLLMLGPGCGTTILDGKGFGIWNSVQRGPVGIVGTFGSGIQQVACLLNEVGVSHALDVGSRDLSQSVNAAGTISALKFLRSDPKTKVIVILSGTPVTSVKKRVLEAAKGTGKQTVLCFLGEKSRAIHEEGLIQIKTFEDAAAQAAALTKRFERPSEIPSISMQEAKKLAEGQYERFGYGQKYVRGLYSGGALCGEALAIMNELLAGVQSNVPLVPRSRMPDLHSSRGHTCIDFGDEELSMGRHPAVDLAPRCERMLKEAKDWEAAVVLLDVILGHGAHPNPAAYIAKATKTASRVSERGGGYLSVVASVIGTKDDPQDSERQREQLEKSGVVVMPSNAQAARIASAIATRGKAWKKLMKKGGIWGSMVN